MCRCTSLTSFLPDYDCALVRLTYMRTCIQAILRIDGQYTRPHGYNRPRHKRRFFASNKQQEPAEAHTKKNQGTNKKKSLSEREKKAKTGFPPCLHRTFDAIDNPAENPSHFSRSPIIQLSGNPLCHHHNPSIEPCTP